MQRSDDSCGQPGKTTGRRFVTTRVFHINRDRSRTLAKVATDGDRVLVVHDNSEDQDHAPDHRTAD